eukprot:Hpha_TRINITY_DN13192_c0_g1::TRINITY_DN13192_c0_g1_i1::g.113359::m.113359
MMELRGPDAKGVFVLQFNNGENRFTGEFFAQLFKALDTVEQNKGPTALVITGTGKFFSNGYNIQYLTTSGEEGLRNFHNLAERFLTFGVPTVSAINGHWFAGGGMLGLMTDYRIGNKEKGFFCLPELDMGMKFTDVMHALFEAKVPLHARTGLVLGAERVGGPQAKEYGIVDSIVPPAEVFPRAMAVATQHAKKGANKALYAHVKRALYHSEIAVIEAAKTRPIPLPPKRPKL